MTRQQYDKLVDYINSFNNIYSQRNYKYVILPTRHYIDNIKKIVGDCLIITHGNDYNKTVSFTTDDFTIQVIISNDNKDNKVQLYLQYVDVH